MWTIRHFTPENSPARTAVKPRPRRSAESVELVFDGLDDLQCEERARFFAMRVARALKRNGLVDGYDLALFLRGRASISLLNAVCFGRLASPRERKKFERLEVSGASDEAHLDFFEAWWRRKVTAVYGIPLIF